MTLSAQVAEYQKAMQDAARSTRETGSEAEKLAQKRQAFDLLGRTALGVGTAMTAMTALSVKAAMGWESAWAGVTKTVDGTPEQLAAVEEGLRGLTSVLPASHDEIAAVAEAAGQLGIRTENVVEFTRTMIDLGETTNLSANDAATALARFTNIMGTSQEQVSNLGSALVGLGNNYATTESEILEMSMRLAGAGRQIGLSEGDVLGLATALSSVGIEAEAGGSAMSKVMIDIAASVEEGGDRVAMFAKTAGMSAEEFSKQWRTAPSEALAAFVKGLANAEAQGSSTLGVLAELGITEVRMRDALLRSSSAADMFTEAMATGNREFEANNALTEEAAKRYETVEARVAIAANAIRDAAIDFGEVFLPVVAETSGRVAEFAQALGDLPDPVQGIIGIATGLGGAVALASGAMLMGVPKIVEYRLALETLGPTAQRAARITTVAFKAMAATAVLSAAVAGLEAFGDALKGTEASVTDLSNAISKGSLDEALAKAVQGTAFPWEVERVKETIQDLGGVLDQIQRGRPSSNSSDPIDIWFDQLKASVENAADALAQLSVDDAVATMGALRDEFELTDANILTLIHSSDTLRDNLIRVADEMGLTADDATLLKIALGEVKPPVSDAEAAFMALHGEVEAGEETLDTYRKALADLGRAAMDMGDAQDSAQSAINSMTEAAKASGVTLDGTNDASIRLRDSLRQVEERHRAAAEAMIDNGKSADEVTDAYTRGRDAIIRQLEAMGLSREEAVRWADENLGRAEDVEHGLRDVARAANEIPTHRNIDISLSGSGAAIDHIRELNRQLAATPSTKHISIDASGGVRGLASPPKPNADGNLYDYAKAFRDGGFAGPGIYQGRPEAIHKFAEPETLWEAYISGKPDQKERNVGVWVESGVRLGVLGGAQSAPTMPDTLIVKDVDGAIVARMRVEADQRIHASEARRAQTVTRGRQIR
ncbi:phage tail tape measure protein [Microbacterium album]|uniref:phage tail tape measure protein n=1 Tax=Microbacterium album TaxID=2053191 RepID=UPI00166ABB45|nr:phage tail tape measure protein [Microbacterium album]